MVLFGALDHIQLILDVRSCVCVGFVFVCLFLFVATHQERTLGIRSIERSYTSCYHYLVHGQLQCFIVHYHVKVVVGCGWLWWWWLVVVVVI